MSQFLGFGWRVLVLPARVFCICLLVVTSAAAQDTPAVKQAEAACGSFRQSFRVDTSGAANVLAPAQAGKVQVYVIEDWDPIDGGRINRPTVRVGMDGHWMGATQSDSYLYFSADPGQHHLCVNWKSGAGTVKNLVALFELDAKPDQTCYFRAGFTRVEGIDFTLRFAPLNSDEARLLPGQYPRARWSVKK
ncbi:MAG TPA: hypothetical protein VME18_05850 [Acidobacteriaceae bacterium]|nr:hypothetical protein [Acidobacteriaceae bacterium]